MAIGASGSKNKSKSSGTLDQTQTQTLSDRAAGYLSGGINDLRGQSYQQFDPSSIAQYQNPYQQDVINASLAQADQTDAMARAQQQSDFAKAGAFGDKRRGIYEAQLAGDQSRDRASLIAGLNSQNYGQAQQTAIGQNDNANNYSLQIQQLLNQLYGGFANEGTTQTNQATTGKSSGYSLNGGWSR